jgi:hypothetical protein
MYNSEQENLQKTCEDHLNKIFRKLTWRYFEYHIWGQVFYTQRDVAAHPNCEVGLSALTARLKSGIPLEQAVLSRKKIVSWGENFFSLQALHRDPRCQVSYNTMAGRLKRGMSPEQACSKWPVGLEEF